MSEYWNFGFTKDSFKAYVSTMSVFAGLRSLEFVDGRVLGCTALTAGPETACEKYARPNTMEMMEQGEYV